MKLTIKQVQQIHEKSAERSHAVKRLQELRSPAKPYAQAKVIFEPLSGRSFVEETRFGTDLGARLHGTMDIYFRGVIERCTKELAEMGVEIEDAA